jgi:hypothetical protein
MRFMRYTLTEAELEHYMRYYGSPSAMVVELKESLREVTTWDGCLRKMHDAMARLDQHQFGLESDLTIDERTTVKVELWALDELVTEGPLTFDS